jgi:hypothetical protein
MDKIIKQSKFKDTRIEGMPPIMENDSPESEDILTYDEELSKKVLKSTMPLTQYYANNKYPQE